MDALRAAAPLARLLLALADSQRQAAVCVRSGARRARLVIDRGRALSLEGVDGEPLGDALLRMGALDAALHGAALSGKPSEGLVGRWLVQVGAAPESAVRDALCAQL